MDVRQARKIRNQRILLFLLAVTVTTLALLYALGLM